MSVERTRRTIDQCITAYLLERLKHDEVSLPSDEPLPSQSSIWNYVDGSMTDLEDKVYIESHQHASPGFQPSQLQGQASREEPSFSRSRNNINNESGHKNGSPYSKSSPGSFFGSHMEQRNRELSSPHNQDSSAECIANQYHYQGDGHGPNEKAPVVKHIFKSLEDYIVTSFGSVERINASFGTIRQSMALRAASEGTKQIMAPPSDRQARGEARTEGQLSELDAKTLLLGDFAENGSWWTGGRTDLTSPERSRPWRGRPEGDSSVDLVTIKSPRIEWVEVNDWYDTVINAGRGWRERLSNMAESEIHSSQIRPCTSYELQVLNDEFLEAQLHLQRVLLKATESLLKRPGRPLSDPGDLRFLLIILANPLLYQKAGKSTEERSRSRSRSRERVKLSRDFSPEKRSDPSYTPKTDKSRGSSGQHSGIIKRILGLLSNLPNDSHHHLVSWFSRYSDSQFKMTADLIGSFVTYRLTRQHGKKREVEQDPNGGLVPNMGGPGRNNSAALHAALGHSAHARKPVKADGKMKPVVYNDDWQIKAAARVMALLFAANNSISSRRGEARMTVNQDTVHSAGLAAREKAHYHGQILPTSDFYNTLLDYSDLVADFEAWESRRGKFAFCQYPFFLSIWAKIQIMEHDARRQMEVKAREAFFDSIMTRKTVNQYLVLKVRRDCLVEDSLRGVGEVVGTGGEEVKKGLRIEFKGEEGIDAGGLRKEWFLLLVRDVFNPEHGMI